MRLQAKGIIDNADFDSIILGTSMLENTSAKEAGQKLGGKWINLSLSGSDFNERKIVFEYALQRKNIRQIIFSIDAYLLNGDRENPTSWRVNSNLYSDGLFLQKYKRYLNKKMICCARKWSKSKDCVGDKKDLETLAQNEYRSSKKHFGGFVYWGEGQKDEVIKQYNEYVKNDFRPKSDETKRLDFEGQKIYLQESILQMIKQNPQTEFSLIFPTYPRFFYALFPLLEYAYHKGRNGAEMFAETKAILKWLVNEVANLDNAKIYGFDDLDYADNIVNYCDSSHYYFDMNSMQLDAIANGTHILTPQNIDKYLATMESKIKNYDIAPLIAEIKSWETQSKKYLAK